MKRRVPVCTLKVSLPATLYDAFMFAVHDPVHNRPAYGAASHIVETLLRDYLKREGLPQELAHNE